jgi:repressor LexA
VTPPKLDVARQVEHDIIVGVRRAERGRLDAAPTPVQVETLDMIRAFIEANGYPPSLRQIMDAQSIQLSTVTYRLRELQRKGYLRWQPGSSRTITLTSRTLGDPCEHCHGTGRAAS